MPKTLPDAYVPVDTEQLRNMVLDKRETFVPLEDKSHDKAIRELMTDRTTMKWGWIKPAPDITYEEAKAEYERPREPDNWGEAVYGTRREGTVRWYEAQVQRCNMLLETIRYCPFGEKVLVASDTLSWLTKDRG